MDKNSLHFKGTYRNVYEVNRAYPNGGVIGDYVDINGWQHWWNPDRGTWCVNENRDTYWDEVLATIQNLVWSKGCTSESDFPSSPTEDERRTAYFYNGQLYLWTGVNGTIRNGQYRSFGVVQGERGVGVSSIAQTSTSNVDGGKNEITVTLTNGDSYKFFTYNGTGRNKGYYYKSLDELKQAVPTPSVTDWAVVDGSVYVCEEGGVWKDTTYSWKPIKLNPFVTELNKLSMPTNSGYLHWDGQAFAWKTPVVNSGGNSGNTGGGTSVDLTQYSWWGRTFDKDTNTITGAMSSVTSIEFLSNKGTTVNKKKLFLDENGDLCFDGNFYATGGITALGSGGGTSGGDSGNTGSGSMSVAANDTVINTKATILNFKYPSTLSDVVTTSGDGLVNIDLSKVAGSGGSGTTTNYLSLVNTYGNGISFNGGATKKVIFGSGLSTSLEDNGDTIKVTASGGGGGTTNYSLYFKANGNNITDDGTTSGDSMTFNGAAGRGINLVGSNGITVTGTHVGSGTITYTISGSGSGSGGSFSGTTTRSLFFYGSSTAGGTPINKGGFDGSHATYLKFEGSGVTVSQNTAGDTTTVTISGGGSTSTSVSWSDVTNKPSTFTPSSHTHTTSEISNLSSYTASKANQLATARTIWGQSFNGTANITGDMSSVGDITGSTLGAIIGQSSSGLAIGYGAMSNKKDTVLWGGNVIKLYLRTSSGETITQVEDGALNLNNNSLKIGNGTLSWDTTNSCFKINGSVYATGGITALGVSNSSTTSNNVDFTFGSVTAKTVKATSSLTVGSMSLVNGVITSPYASDASLVFIKGISGLNLNASSSLLQITESSFNLSVAGSSVIKSQPTQSGSNLKLNNVETLIFGVVGQYGYSRYKFNISKAISAGILESTTETFSADEEDNDTPVVQPASETDRAVQIGESTESSQEETDTDISESQTDTETT